MLDQLVEASAHYLAMQAKAGADALMLFESWAEGLPRDAFEQWVTTPTQMLISRVRELGVTVPILGFPRGSGANLIDFACHSGVDAIGLDTAVPLQWADKELPGEMPVQGNLDPMQLVAGGPNLDQAVSNIITELKLRPHIFNLGHGVVPETPIAHVEQTLRVIRSMA
jgi:uroporphyrinogen decarboxylase